MLVVGLASELRYLEGAAGRSQMGGPDCRVCAWQIQSRQVAFFTTPILATKGIAPATAPGPALPLQMAIDNISMCVNSLEVTQTGAEAYRAGVAEWVRA